MRGKTKSPWTPDQLDLLQRMIAKGYGYGYTASMVGHSLLSCRTKMSEIRSALREGRVIGALAPSPVSAPPKPSRLPSSAPIASRPLAPILPKAVAEAPYLRATSTAKFVMDAELRARIEVQGVTAGLLGDPLPGRSALDRKRAGIVEAPDHPGDRRYCEFAAPVDACDGAIAMTGPMHGRNAACGVSGHGGPR